MQVTKYVLPVVVGSMSGMILIVAGNNIVELMYPTPPGTDKYDAESVNRYLGMMPAQGFVMLLVNYAICSFLAGLIATLISGRVTMRPALIVGFALLCSGLYYVVNFHLPVWFAITSLIVYLPCAYAGYMAVRKKAAVA